MKRVAIISINGSRGGGVESVVRWQVEVLKAAGCDVRVVQAPLSISGGLIKKIIRKVIIVCFPWISCIVARAWARQKGIVIAHASSSVGLGCDAVFAHGCWHVASEVCGVSKTLYSRFTCTCERISARLSRRIVCVSHGVESDWIKHYGARPHKTEVLHNTCDINLYTFGHGGSSSTSERYNNLLFVGRVEVRKGVDFLIQLCNEINASGASNISLTICTPTPLEDSLLARLPGARILVGLSAFALRDEYRKAQALILPSQYEAFEMVTVEALCCGTPVILNDTGTRPFLEQSQCPGMFKLQPNVSPLKQIDEAFIEFERISREDLATWARSTFNPEASRRRLLELVGVQ